MTVKELKDILNTFEDNAPIYVLAMDGTHLTRDIQVGGDYSVFITDINDDYTVMAKQPKKNTKKHKKGIDRHHKVCYNTNIR